MVVELVNKTRYMYIDTKQLTIPKYCRFPERYNISFALKLSIFAHKNQVDKAGVQYLYHILDVAKQATSDEEFIVALLHDFIEDAENIACQNRRIDVVRNVFDKNIFQAIIAITKISARKPLPSGMGLSCGVR